MAAFVRESSLTEQFAEFIIGTNLADIPAPVVRFAKHDLLDLIGCVIQGQEFSSGRASVEYVRSFGCPGSATVWGTGVSGRAEDVAMAIGTLGHSFDFDDYHSRAKLHAAVAVFPAVVAVAEESGLSGEAVLEAGIIGMEAMIRLSLATNPVEGMLAGFHMTGLCGPFGAAAGLAKLLGLNREQTADALGLACTQGAGLIGFLTDGSDSKRLHAGKAAHSGLLSVRLAMLGMSGPRRVVEMEHGGFCHSFSDNPDLGRLMSGLGDVWEVSQISLKRFPTCGGIQTTVDLIREAIADVGSGDDIATVRVGHNPATIRQNGADYVPGDALRAQMNLRYCAAAVLLEGDLMPQQFRSDLLASDLITRRVADVSVDVDDEVAAMYPKHAAARVGITTVAGETREYFATGPRGGPADPLTPEEVREKFWQLSVAALGERACQAAVAAVETLETAHSVGDLIAALTPNRPPQVHENARSES